ncbi:MAG: O-acetylhomoserine aminocarboxypropyltransferase/cysteine synthase [bacterium]
MTDRQYKFNTIALHGGHEVDKCSHSRAVPIYQTSSFVFDSPEHAAALFALEESGNIYTRLMNPTTDVLEKRVAMLENGAAGLAVASGQSAELIAITNLCNTGDNFVCSSSLYGGSYTLFVHTLKKFGIEARIVKSNDFDAMQAAIDSKTKAIYGETIGNPQLDVFPIAEVAAIAHDNDIPLIIDNTMASPYHCRPLDWGADIVIHSATKYLGGHGTSIAGVIVDSGAFDWGCGNFPGFTTPDASYHDMIWCELPDEMRRIAFIVKARLCGLRDMGPAISPFNSFLILQGIETLHLRMQRHSENAMAVAEFLSTDERVSWVNYPGLASHETHNLAQKYFTNGYSGMIGFGVKGGKTAGSNFIRKVKLCSHLANIGDAKTLIIHPASTTHQQLSEEELIACGVTPDFIRLSVGIEDINDILSDIDQALG